MGEGKKEVVKREFSSGGAVYRKLKVKSEKLKVVWLVTQSAATDLYPKQVWRLPKGWIDEGETTKETAVREVKEEGGVEAKIIKKIETVKYFFTTPDREKNFKFVTFYLMEWQKDLPEGFGEESAAILWLPFDEAYAKLTYKGEKEILEKAKNFLV